MYKQNSGRSKVTKMRVCFSKFNLLMCLSSVLSVEIDYYWRNYNGDVPSDVFQAGIDAAGKPIYIGQGFFVNAGLLPGTLRRGSTNFKATAQLTVFHTDKFVKILCTKHPQNFRWIHVNSQDDISSLTNVHLVEGGIETNSVLHIARARHEGDTEIGKIYNLGVFKGGAFPNRQEQGSDYKSFDLLIYAMNLIDVRSN